MTSGSLTRHASLVTVVCEALVATQPLDGVLSLRGEAQILGVVPVLGARLASMSNASELLIKSVTENISKWLTGMNREVVSLLFLWDSEIRHHKAPGEKAGPNWSCDRQGTW